MPIYYIYNYMYCISRYLDIFLGIALGTEVVLVVVKTILNTL